MVVGKFDCVLIVLFCFGWDSIGCRNKYWVKFDDCGSNYFSL